jgi:hypothetical protein
MNGEARQLKFAQIGATGCQIDAMRFNGEQETGGYIDLYRFHLDGMAVGLVGPDCAVLDNPTHDSHDLLMNMLTPGKTWKSTLESPTYVAKPGERLVLYWEWQDGATLHTHFTTPDYDPYGASLTVKNGKLMKIRAYRRVS